MEWGELVEKDGGFYVHYADHIPSSLYAYIREHKDMSEIPDTGSRHFVDFYSQLWYSKSMTVDMTENKNRAERVAKAVLEILRDPEIGMSFAMEFVQDPTNPEDVVCMFNSIEDACSTLAGVLEDSDILGFICEAAVSTEDSF